MKNLPTMRSISLLSFTLLSAFVLLISCQPAPTSKGPINPPAPGFDIQGSDAKAVSIADEVMDAMGGRAAWDATEQISWNFFGRRALDWDKSKNTVEVNLIQDSTIIALNMNDNTGSLVMSGEAVSHPDSLAKYLKQAKSIWINDSYWLVMPFKLKDSGVTLKYISRDTTASGLHGDKLALTFAGVGNTPENKYEVIVTDEKRLVEEWRFYSKATDTIPRFVTPWVDYKKYGDILLSGDRGRFQLSDISVGKSQ